MSNYQHFFKTVLDYACNNIEYFVLNINVALNNNKIKIKNNRNIIKIEA